MSGLFQARALARCGDPEGLGIMAGYLNDTRRMFAHFAHFAHQELTLISG